MIQKFVKAHMYYVYICSRATGSGRVAYHGHNDKEGLANPISIDEEAEVRTCGESEVVT